MFSLASGRLIPAARYRACAFAWPLTPLNNLNAHATGGPLHSLNCRLQTSRIQIRQFQPRDVFDLLLSDRPNLILVRFARALCDIRRPLEQNRCRRRLGDEAVGTIHINRDHDGNDQTLLILCRRFRIERLAEVHDVDAVLAKRRSNRRSRRGFACRNLQLDLTNYFLCHNSVTSAWRRQRLFFKAARYRAWASQTVATVSRFSRPVKSPVPRESIGRRSSP